jgi:hypothetical protein
VDHLNGLHRNLQFTTVTQKDSHHPFLDIAIYRRLDGSLGHKVYQTPTLRNLPWLMDHITILPANKPFLQPWYKGPGLYATRKASIMSWNSLRPLPGKQMHA